MSTVVATKIASWSAVTVMKLKAAHTLKMLKLNALQQVSIICTKVL